MTTGINQSPTTTSKKAMTRKQALAVLHHFYDAYAFKSSFSSEQFDQDAHLRTEVREALRVLTTAVHGSRLPFPPSLCRICYLRYGDRLVKIKHEFIEYVLRDCCDSCLEQLRASGQLFEDKKAEVR